MLLASITLNYGCGRALAAAAAARRKAWLLGALGANQALLAYYKYANFFVDSLNRAGAGDWVVPDIVLPIGISFFIVRQLLPALDRRPGAAPQGHNGAIRRAGQLPAVGIEFHHRPVDFRRRPGEKVLIADNISPMVGPVYGAGAQPQLLEAWIGTLAYTLQLYFDFSGYSDMAIGLSRLFGVRLPLNFNSPYKARDIGDFWRRWHAPARACACISTRPMR